MESYHSAAVVPTVRLSTNLSKRFNVIWPVQSRSEKESPSGLTQIKTIQFAVPARRGVSRSSRTLGRGCDGRGSAPLHAGHPVSRGFSVKHKRLWNTESSGHPRSSRGQAPGGVGESGSRASGSLKSESENAGDISLRRPGLEPDHRTLLLRRSSTTWGPTIDSAIWVLAFREDDACGRASAVRAA